MKLVYLEILVVFIRIAIVWGVDWNLIKCATDAQTDITEGRQPMNKFSWLGIIQHNFDVGGVLKFAVTSAVLVHPGYAIAPAEDISKIPYEHFRNSTHLILWYSASVKYAIEVTDYVLHPEFVEGLTAASLALVELQTYGETGLGGHPRPVLPICIPLRGSFAFKEGYAAKMSDENQELHKELYGMTYVDDVNCKKFYKKHQLDQTKMAPTLPVCARVTLSSEPCVWDAGVALINKQTWGYWTLMGFGSRGAGCAAPARFLAIADYVPWINDVITPQPAIDGYVPIGIRALTPYQVQIYQMSKKVNPKRGQCQKQVRGRVQYKDFIEMTTTQSIAYGFYFIAISQIASYSCVVVKFEEVLGRSNTGVWVEHNCHRDYMGQVDVKRKEEKPLRFRTVEKVARSQCFMYFKTTAYIEFRFFFSFVAVVDVTLYGNQDDTIRYNDPFKKLSSTSAWWPTDAIFLWAKWTVKYGYL